MEHTEAMLAAETCIIYYHGCDWNDIPARQQCLMKAISSSVPVIFLDGSSAPRFAVSYEYPEPNVTVVRGLVAKICGLNRRGFRRTAGGLGKWYTSWIRRRYKRILFWTSENCSRPDKFIPHNSLIYDCIDPCFIESAKERFDRCEEEIARAAPVVFCTAESLLERMKSFNDSSYLLPNGCSAEDYEPDTMGRLSLPVLLRGRRTPIIGYMGTIDWRIDAETIIQAAERLPQFTFAIIGRVNHDQEARTEKLRELPNVVMSGPVSVEEGRAFTAAFDVGIIPFFPGEMGDAINPVKMHMYLMAGKPVVSTWLRECRRYAPYVMAARNIDEFVDSIQSAVAANSEGEIAARVAFAKRNSWTIRAREALQVLAEIGLLHAPEGAAPSQRKLLI
jgi:glycosyltransferase involved in cell wall biosynthesis